MTEKLVSIIVPIYNTGELLRSSLDSILTQSYKNLEIILVDDGSTDNSGQIIDEYQKKDARVIALHQANAGQAGARNAGIRLARGEFISFIDGDDSVNEDFIAKLVKKMTDDVGLAMTGMAYHYVKQNVTKNVYIKKLRSKKPNESIKAYMLYLLCADGRIYSVINKLFRTEIIKNAGLEFPTGIYFGEDTRFVMNYLDNISGKIEFVLEPLYNYNSGNAGSTVKKSGIEKSNWQALYKDLKNWVGKPGARERFWLNLVSLRWKISLYRTKRRAKKAS